MTKAEEIRKIGGGRYFVDVDSTQETLPKKIRNAQKNQYNFIVVVGEKEVNVDSLAVRSRDGSQLGVMKVDSLVNIFKSLEENFQ